MKRILAAVGGAVAMLWASWAQAAVVSANGFTCQATPTKAGQLVECSGQFPGVAGLFGATGRDLVQIEYSPDNKRRFFYMSDTGCLILNADDNTAAAVDKSGTKKTFTAFLDAMSWCYTGAAPAAPSAPQGQAAPPQTPAPQQQTQKPVPPPQPAPTTPR